MQEKGLKAIVLVILMALIALTSAQAVLNGDRTFYARTVYSNLNFGAGAAFEVDIWYKNTPAAEGSVENQQFLRLDYIDNQNNTYLREVFDYVTNDRYQLCIDGVNVNCQRSRFVAPQPFFFVPDTTTHTVVPEPARTYFAVADCGVNSIAYQFNQNGPFQASFVVFRANGTLCRVINSNAGTSDQFQPEYHVQSYFPRGAVNGPAEDPFARETYTGAFANQECPEPRCFAVLDLALVIDESGSMADNRDTVRNFTLSLINRLSIGNEDVRIGLVYFSGGVCTREWNGVEFVECTGGCGTCGGVYNVTFQGLSGDLNFVNNIVSRHEPAGGFTCLECGISEGANALQRNPRQGIPQALILVTDANQNRHADLLDATAQANIQAGITSYAVAIGTAVNFDELRTITGSDDRIFRVSDFAALLGEIDRIVLPLCQALPEVDRCESCPGLCNCGVDCQAPNSCDDSNVCTVGTSLAGEGICVQSQIVCDDGNACTVDTCDPTRGCVYTQTRPISVPADDTCTVFRCNPSTGAYFAEDVGEQNCGQISGDLCNVRFCNRTRGQCQTISKSSLMAGQNLEITDSSGPDFVITGCDTPTDAFSCIMYGCDAVTGQCTVNNTCECTTDAGCNDGDGCTIDRCNDGECERQEIDCLSELSNGNCAINGISNNFDIAATVSASLSFIEENNVAQFAVNGTTNNPTTGVDRNCGELACFLGQPSEYRCVSNGDNLHTCTRFVREQCNSNGCINNVCTPQATIMNRQIGSSCVVEDFTCDVVNDGCNTAVCNTSAPAFPRDRRCSLRRTTVCDDNNACTSDTCVPGLGCVYAPIAPPADRMNTTCLDFECRGGDFFPIAPGNCRSNPTDLCIIDFCDTENDMCGSLNRTSTVGSTTLTSALGNTFEVQGCARPANVPDNDCIVYGCDSATGECTIDSSACECTVDNVLTSCNNNDGCTTPTCVNNMCVFTPVDCLSNLSNGLCTRSSTGFTTGTQVSTDILYGNSLTDFTLNGNRPLVGQSRTCEELACFLGEPSSYQCISVNEEPVCIRNSEPCTSTGCQDRLCELTSSTFVDGRFDTRCVDGDAAICPNSDCSNLRCDVGAVAVLPLTDRCIATPNDRCDDNDLCTTDTCTEGAAITCTNEPLVAPADFTCFDSVCNNGVFTNVSKTNACPAVVNQCMVRYCDPTSDTCVSIDRTTIRRDEVNTFTNNFFEEVSVTGCAAPLGAQSCAVYGCNTATGACTVDTTACVCRIDADCQDQNGCTEGRCVDGGTRCDFSPVDCYAELSNNNCVVNQPYTASQSVGRFFAGMPTVINNEVGNPEGILRLPRTGINRTCNDLACFDGQRNRYFCRSDSPTTHTCLRSPVNCFGNAGCGSNFCESLGGWFNGQIRTNCFQEDVFCNDDNPCTIDRCNANYNPMTDAPEDRCIFTPVNNQTFCDDGDDCTVDMCNPCVRDSSNRTCEHTTITGPALDARCPPQGCKVARCSFNRCVFSDVVCPNPIGCASFVCNPLNNTCAPVIAPGFSEIDCIRQIETQDNVTLPTSAPVPTGPSFSVCSYTDNACVQNPFCVRGVFGRCNSPFISGSFSKSYIVDLIEDGVNRVRFFESPRCEGVFTDELNTVRLGQCGTIDGISFRFTGSAATLAASLFVVLAMLASILF